MVKPSVGPLQDSNGWLPLVVDANLHPDINETLKVLKLVHATALPMATFWESTYDDGLPTHSTNEQLKTEDACRAVFEEWINPDGSLSRESCASRQRVNDNEPCACRPIPLLTTCLTCARDRSVSFCRTEHAAYLKAGLGSLAAGYVSLDASRPWLTYWISHSLELLGPSHALRGDEADNVVGFLRRCQVPGTGGFAGGAHPGQIAHLAPTYAAINTLVTIGTPAALAAIDRASLRVFLRRMKRPDGSFSMHDDGECDVRGVYTALAVASLTNLLDDELRRGAAEWIASCQTYEGGIGATPGEEAHGGYTFCGLASMVLLDRVELLRVPPLTRWLVERQMGVHGGFQGRTNKLVDGCYSFWQGGAFPLLEAALTRTAELPSGGIASLFSTDGLLDYLFVCCQQSNGGLRDKPGRGCAARSLDPSNLLALELGCPLTPAATRLPLCPLPAAHSLPLTNPKAAPLPTACRPQPARSHPMLPTACRSHPMLL
jgi:protein farnesyltransferase subunit beta